ncbi:MAG: beta strand repeat-containing protein [Gammaproteobacteria bacterium]
MAVSTQTKQLLQELYIFATGQAANTSEMAMIEALVGENGNLDNINKLIDTYINQKAQQHGVVGMVKILANNGMGVTLTDAEANAAIADFSAAGLTTWSSLFQWAAANESIYGVTLTNRGDAASYFTDALAKSDKTDLFAGTSINTAVSNLLKTISGTLTSVSTAQQGLDELAARLTENGLTSAVVDGYLAGATIFADANGNGVLDPDTEWSATTDENGNYVLPVNLPAGSLIAFGGTDLLTGQAFQGVLSAPAGSTVVTPLTSMIQALLENDPDTDIATATNNVRSALNLPDDVDLQTYDPIAVLNNSSASDADKAKALAIQNVSLQVANVLTQAGNALSAANGATTLQSATGAVTKALAAALSGGSAFDLGNQSSLSSVLNSAANASASPLTPDQINQITTVTAQSNAAAASATTITALAKVAVVAQGSATTAIINGTTNNTLDSTVINFTGANFTNSVNAATPANVPGSTTTPDPTPTPTPTPPATTFLATLDSSGLSNVVSFSGTATGEITISFTTTGASTKDATFTRAGISATKLTNYDGSAVTVTIANGQSLSSDAANLTNLGALSGAGNVIVTGTPSINELSGINVSGLTGTLTYSHVTDVANKLDQASDSIYENTAVNVTVTDGDTASIAQLNQIDALWGTVTPQRVTDIANNLDEAADSLFENTTINVTVTDAATLAQLAQIDALWGTVTYTNISDSVAALTANTGGYITGAVNLSVSDSATIAQLNTVDGYTSGTVTALQIADSAATIAASSYVSATTAVALSSGTAAAVDLSTIDGMTTVALDASAVTTLTGTAAQITAAYAANTTGTITGLGNEIATASDTGTVAATVLTDLDALTIGAVGFASVTTLTGTAAQVAAAYTANTDGTITGLNDEAVILSGSASALDITAIKTGNSAGTINGSALTSINGSAAAVAQALAALDNAPTNFNAALTGSASAGERATIVGAVGTGTIDYSGITTLVVTSSTDITGFTWAAAATSLDATASPAINITMTMAQHNAFTTAINANGANDTITFTDVGTFTADADIKTYALKVGDNSVTTGVDGQIFQPNVSTETETVNDVLTLNGSHNVSVELYHGSLSAGSATGAITVSNANAAVSNTIATGSGDDVISVGAGADNIDGGAGDDIFLITSNADVTRLPLTGPFNTINGGTHSSGDTLRIIGTTEAYLPTATITGIEILDLTTSASVQTVYITATQLGALTTVTADASDVLFISSLDGATIGHTNAIDHFSFDDADSNVSITSFSTAVDQVGFSSMKHTGGKAEVTGNISAVNDGKIWFLGNQSAGAADSLASSAAALSAAAIWGNPAGNYTNYVVLADDDSTALYKLNDVSASADEIVSSELTLIGVVNGVLGIGNINTSIEPFVDATGA